jgi:hypothetical protein
MNGRLVRRRELQGRERGEMLRLLGAHFDGVVEDVFDADLAEKNWVLLIEEEGRLRGFSTLLVYETCLDGEPATVVYSGDTIVERCAWHSSALARCWIGSVQALRSFHSRGPLYWLLLTSGFRTYRLLPVFWREFHPRFDTEVPAGRAASLRRLASERFGQRYDPDLGIVRFAAPQVLRGDLATIPDAKRRDPHVAFFLERNPGWSRGDELVCLTEIAPGNLTAAGTRMWREGARSVALPPARSA